MDDADVKARKLATLHCGGLLPDWDMAFLADAIAAAMRDAEHRGMMHAAGMVWDELPEMTRKHLGKRGKREKVLRLEIRDSIEARATEPAAKD